MRALLPSDISRKQTPEEESHNRQVPSEEADTIKSLATDQSKSGKEGGEVGRREGGEGRREGGEGRRGEERDEL